MIAVRRYARLDAPSWLSVWGQSARRSTVGGALEPLLRLYTAVASGLASGSVKKYKVISRSLLPADDSVDRLGCAAHGHAPPPHVPDGGAAETASAALSAPSHPAPATPGSRLLHKLHAAACAVLCGGHQERACPQPLCSWRACESGQHSSTAHSTARSSVAASSPERTSPTARLPSCTAPPAPHTSSRDMSITGVAASCRCAHARTPSCTRPRWRGSRTRMRMRQSAAMWQLQAASRRQQLVGHTRLARWAMRRATVRQHPSHPLTAACARVHRHGRRPRHRAAASMAGGIQQHHG